MDLNVFLNDYCKDAINLEDFRKLSLELKDVLNDGVCWYYVDNCVSVKRDLNDIPVTQRPIHCTDKQEKELV